MTLTRKLTGIITDPNAVYDEVAESDRTPSNWLVPLALMIAVSIAMFYVELSNPVLVSRMEEEFGPKIRFGIEQAVRDGQFTRQEAEKLYTLLQPGSPVFGILQSAALALWQSAALFALSLLYWLVGKSAMGGTAPYMKVVEVVGLALVIDMLEAGVRAVLANATGSLFVTPGPSLLLPSYNPENRYHLLLSAIDLFTFWKLWVLGIGLSALYQRDRAKVLVLIVAIWILWTLLSFFGSMVAAP